MRRTLLALAAGLALATVAPAASASHPCLNWSELTCALTRPCVKDICT